MALSSHLPMAMVSIVAVGMTMAIALPVAVVESVTTSPCPQQMSVFMFLLHADLSHVLSFLSLPSHTDMSPPPHTQTCPPLSFSTHANLLITNTHLILDYRHSSHLFRTPEDLHTQGQGICWRWWAILAPKFEALQTTRGQGWDQGPTSTANRRV